MQILNSIERTSFKQWWQQRLKLFSRLFLLFITVISALIIGLLPVQFLHNGSLTADASTKLDSNLNNRVGETDLHQIPRSDFLQRSYSTATVLLENVGGNTVELSSALDGLGYFSILEEGDTYYLWLNSYKLEPRPRHGIEQRLESQDGLVWRNRTDTDLDLQNDLGGYKFLHGLRSVINNGDTYEGWESYYYEWSLGWAYAVRYMTSTNGINWAVVNKPSQIGAAYPNVIEDGGIYHSWARVDVDNYHPNEPQIIRYRTSNKGGSGWSHWRTGGDPVTVDGQVLADINFVVRQSRDGVTYELFYITDDQMHLATSDNGITFTTQMTNILDFAVLVPDKQRLGSFKVVDVEGVDWFYFVYQDQDDVYRLAVSRPDESQSPMPTPTNVPTSTPIPTSTPVAPSNTYSVYLPVVLSDYTPPATFPVHIGDAIARRGVAERGQVFYRKAVDVPANLPADGHFYLSSKPDAVVETLVDDKVVILLGGVEVLTYNFSANGSPEPTVVEVPRATMEQMAGKTILIEYRDVYGYVVEARAMWLIWSPS